VVSATRRTYKALRYQKGYADLGRRVNEEIRGYSITREGQPGDVPVHAVSFGTESASFGEPVRGGYTVPDYGGRQRDWRGGR
jgi:hypothetical protein